MAEKNLMENKWVKLGITVGIIAGAAGLTYLVAKKIIKEFVGDPSKDLGKEIGKEVNESKLSYPESQYKSMADSVYNAMNGAGTNTETIYRVFKQLKNADDWKKLVSVYGVKKEKSTWGSFSGNLVEWLEDDLDSGELQEVSNILNKIGVTF